jgi:hypothetical protein
MDFKKKLVIYGSILLGLAVLFAVGTIVQALSLEPQGQKVFAQLKTDAVEKIEVTDRTGKLEIAKGAGQNGAWQILAGGKQYDASKSAVDGLLANFADVRKLDVVTGNKDNWPSFNVDDANAVHIVLAGAGGAALAECWFGKGGATSFSQYVRLPGSPDVIQTDLRVEKTALLKDWVERRLFGAGFYVDDVERVLVKTSLVFGGDAKPAVQHLAYTLVPGDKNKEGYTTWKLAENEKLPLAPQKVSTFVNAMAGFTGDDVVQDPEELKLDPSRALGSIVVRLKKGQSYTLYLLGRAAGDPNTFYVTNQDDKYVYTSNNWSLQGLFGGANEIIDTTALLAPR